MAKNTYLSTIESRKETKQTRIDGCQMGGW